MPASDQGINPNQPARYAIIPRTLIFVRRQERFLLIKGAADKRLWAGKYNGIGGHIEPGEDVLSAARRELLEESGMDVPQLELAGIVIVDTGRSPGIGMFVLSGEAPAGEPKASAEGALEWLSQADLAGLPVVEDLPLILEALARRKTGQAPFSARSYYDEQGRLQLVFA